MNNDEPHDGVTRRQWLGTSAATLALGAAASATAQTLQGTPEWVPFAHNGPLTPQGNEVEAIVERLIPADDLSISGKDAGCAVFIDRQLAGEYGHADRLYMQGPFRPGTPAQADQSPLTPRGRYRLGLAGLSRYCQAQHQKEFSALDDTTRDQILTGLEKGTIHLDEIDAATFFKQVHGNTMEGFFADPIYGGNRDMVSWKMLGFPGARYDYRAQIGQHNVKLDLQPISIAGNPRWNNPKG